MAAPSTAYTAADEAALDERLQRLRLRVVQVGLATSGVLFGRACSHQMSTTTQQQRRKRMRLRRLVATYEASLPTFAEGASRIDAIHAALEEHRGMCQAFSTGVCVVSASVAHRASQSHVGCYHHQTTNSVATS